MKRTFFFFTTSLLLLFFNGFTQVGINTDGNQADPSAGLDVKFINKGFLPPRIALVSINSPVPIASPAIGLFVYNSATNGTPPNNVMPGYYSWNGTKWIPVQAQQGINIGDMQYWNGTQWVIIPAGLNGQVLTFSNGVPTWGGVQLPIVSTNPITNISSNSANCGGNVVIDGGAIVTTRGVCWSVISTPTTLDSHTTDGYGTGNYISSFTGLNSNTLYYVRAYATNSVGTSYGNQMTFTTFANLPSVTTANITNIAQTTATGGGNVTSDGGAAVTVKGICWSTSEPPTIGDSKSTDGSGTGSFISSLSGLNPNTLYYVRAYATNIAGTGYGNQMTFSTISLLSIDYLLLGGGGAGGTQTTANYGGAGGGAGGSVVNGSTTIENGVYSVIVGAGGVSSNGGASSFGTIASAFGGYRGGQGTRGPSGGGNVYHSGGLGYNNGDVWSAGGGGAGASANGGSVIWNGNYPSNYGGNGGVGSDILYNTWGYDMSLGYGGGGGFYTSGHFGSGNGYGGDGSTDIESATSGALNSSTAGNGGGGGGKYVTTKGGADGSRGIVILRYLGSPKASGGTISTHDGYTFHLFTTSGSFVLQ